MVSVVCLYLKNVKTVEPIGPKFFVVTHMTPGKIKEKSNLKKYCQEKMSTFIIFENTRIYTEKSAKNSYFLERRRNELKVKIVFRKRARTTLQGKNEISK